MKEGKCYSSVCVLFQVRPLTLSEAHLQPLRAPAALGLLLFLVDVVVHSFIQC